MKQFSKAEVDYSTGTKDEHCGICTHFEVVHRNGCEIVKGFIRAPDWCKKFNRDPKLIKSKRGVWKND